MIHKRKNNNNLILFVLVKNGDTSNHIVSTKLILLAYLTIFLIETMDVIVCQSIMATTTVFTVRLFWGNNAIPSFSRGDIGGGGGHLPTTVYPQPLPARTSFPQCCFCQKKLFDVCINWSGPIEMFSQRRYFWALPLRSWIYKQQHNSME